MKHILVPTDFSENAYTALIYATQLFEKNPCTIHILHSIEVQTSRLTSRVDIGHSEQILDQLYDNADRKCEALIARLQQSSKGYRHQFDVISTAMSLPRAMNRICVQRDVDLVIMGTKGQTGAQEVFLGSNTIKVISKIKDTPVLVIPPEANFHPVKRVAFPTSFERDYHPSELHELLFLAELHNSEIRILHVREGDTLSKEQRKHLDNLMELLGDTRCKVEWLDPDAGLTATINNYVLANDVDLMAIVYYKHNFVVRLFRESIVKKIGRNPTTPYLVIPAR